MQIDNLKEEIAICKIVVKELAVLVKKYEKQVDKEKEKEKKLQRYEDLEQAREAYGFGEITKQEFEKLQDYFDCKEQNKTVKELYLQYIEKEYRLEKKNLSDLEKELFKEELVSIARS